MLTDIGQDLDWEGAVPRSRRFDDPYFAGDGAAETAHVFLAGNGLPARFRDGFHIAELGFGTGLNLAVAWAAFRAARAAGTSDAASTAGAAGTAGAWDAASTAGAAGTAGAWDAASTADAAGMSRLPGASGAPGMDGTSGVPGAADAPSASDAAGMSAPAGASGRSSAWGTPGAVGTPGPPGAWGTLGAVGTPGPPVAWGTPSASSAPGAAGTLGSGGMSGAAGVSGNAAAPGRLIYTGFEAYPMAPDDMARALAAYPDLPGEALVAMRAEGRTRLVTPDLDATLVLGDARQTLPAWIDGRRTDPPGSGTSADPQDAARPSGPGARGRAGGVDAWFLDGFAPAKNPQMWEAGLMAAVARATAPGGTFATYTAAGDVRRALAAAGFEVARVPGFGRKRHMTRGVLPVPVAAS